MKTVRWGILSTARINRRLIPEIRKAEGAELHAVASRDLARGIQYANEWKIPVVYESYKMLLADESIDVVYVPLPNHLHAQWAIEAMEAGKHVLCEKPLCLTLEELERLQETSQRTGKVVMEAFMYMHHPQTMCFLQLVKEGAIGKLVAIQSEFAATFNRPADNYRMSADQGGGALWDVGVYPVSFSLLFDPSEIQNVSAKAVLSAGVDEHFWGRIDFASGVSSQFYASFAALYSTRTSLIGTTGRLEITHPFNAADDCRAWLSDEMEKKELHIPRKSLYAGQIENMNAIARGEAQPFVSLAQSRRILQTILALRKAAEL